MKVTKKEVKAVFLALLISLTICLILFALYLLWLRLSPQEIGYEQPPNRIEELQEISSLPIEERRNLILTGVWGENYRENIIHVRQITQSPWDLVSFGVVRPNTSYDLLALTVLLLYMYPHIAMERDHYIQVLPGGLFIDVMEYHVSVPNMTFLYPYGIEVPVVQLMGIVNGVIVNEIIDFR